MKKARISLFAEQILSQDCHFEVGVVHVLGFHVSSLMHSKSHTFLGKSSFLARKLSHHSAKDIRLQSGNTAEGIRYLKRLKVKKIIKV